MQSRGLSTFSRTGGVAGPVFSGRSSVVVLPGSRRALASATSGNGDGTGLTVDPESKLRQYGKDFGKGAYKIDTNKYFGRVRARTPADTADSQQKQHYMEELMELAALNERLSGELQPWEARSRLEYLRLYRRNWEAIYDYITENEVTATLAIIEEANRKVEEALSSQSRERTSISGLKTQLLSLQDEVEAASAKLTATQERVEQNLQRVNRLKAEAAMLERIKESTSTAARQGSTSTSYGREDEYVRSNGTQRPKKVKGLRSSLDTEPALKNFWFPIEFCSKLTQNTLVPLELCGEQWVLFRDERGQPSCIKDQCAHRACPLSAGQVVNGQVECPYHGWKFNGDGACVEMPSTKFCKNVAVTALPCAEKDGFVWVWPGEGTPADTLPDSTAPPPGFEIHAEICVDVPVEHGLLVENLLDLAHAPFTHQSTFARGWPVPDAVKFHATQLLRGDWDPYPINMAFHPPCMTESLIGLAQPGKIMRGITQDKCKNHLHQVHVCLPSRKGHTRLLYRMSLDFMGWLKHVPLIDKVWKGVAGQVLGEDMKLVTGQQDRLERGGDTWSNPMPYDKLGVRYRRWRNSVAAGDDEEAWTLARSARMGAGELFSIDEDDDVKREEEHNAN